MVVRSDQEASVVLKRLDTRPAAEQINFSLAPSPLTAKKASRQKLHLAL